MRSIGDRVKEKRLQRRMSQLELADRSGLRQSHISQLETNVRSNPQAHIVIALAKTLDCSTDFLLGLYERAEQTRAP